MYVCYSQGMENKDNTKPRPAVFPITKFKCRNPQGNKVAELLAAAGFVIREIGPDKDCPWMVVWETNAESVTIMDAAVEIRVTSLAICPSENTL